MKGIDGFGVTARIRKNPHLADSVILMVSAGRYLADVARCRNLGVNEFLAKPIGQSDLLDSILSVLGVYAVEERLVRVAVPVEESPKRQRLKILLAEDNPVNQKLAIRLLEKAGHGVVLADSGAEAVAAWKQTAPSGFDLVLMDIQMPVMDGMEATAAIREREKKTGEHVPIIAMTAHAMRGDKERYLAAGMNGYVSKPIHPTTLFDEIERVLVRGKEKKANRVPSQEQPDHLDRASLLDRVEGDHELLVEMIHLFLEDAPQLLAAMRQALEGRDMPVLERSAHSMKGAASNFSADTTVAAAAQLEKDAKSGEVETSRASLAVLEGAVKQLLPALAELCQGVSK
jgi:two-component system, sensor histidine kinase and response regulator